MKFIILCTALLLSTFTDTASAQSLMGYDIPGCNFREGTIEASCIPTYIAWVIGQVFQLTGVLSLIMIMVGGFEYTLDNLGGGKERGIKRIQHGILGMVISGLAFFIVNFAVATFIG